MIKFKIVLLTTTLLFQGTEKKKYTLDKHNIEFTVDRNWEYQKISDDTYVFKFKCAKEIPFCKNITIRVIKNTDKQTIDQLTQTLVDYIPKRFDQYQIISVRDEKVNDRQFRVIDYKFREENLDLGNTTLVYFTALNQPEKSYVNERKILFELLKTLSVK
ncbi:MAG: hypothetical protein KF856_07660 [Cyclobacteriaceae bacterium]|nr:hypothetical protein [Cyclobacteriaceae bacterium]